VALPHNVRFTVTCDSPGAFRRACRVAAREGVDVFKVNVSGDRGFEEWGAGSHSTVITDEELAAVVQVANARGKVVAAHAVSAGAVKMCLRQGVTVIYHAAFCDEEAMDMLGAAKERAFVAPTVGFPYTLTHEADRYGVTFDAKTQARNERELASIVAGATEMRKRGIRVLPGGDYGLFCNPQGTNARDLEHFVNLLGFSPMQAIQAATRLGGQLMGRPEGLGCIAPGHLADLLGRPAAFEATQNEGAQIVVAFQTRALPAPGAGLLLGIGGLVADLGAMVAFQLARYCRWRAIQSCRDLPDRLPAFMKAGNRAPVFKSDVIIMFSHRNTLTWCCTSFVSLGHP